jgi:hypothetical protein
MALRKASQTVVSRLNLTSVRAAGIEPLRERGAPALLGVPMKTKPFMNFQCSAYALLIRKGVELIKTAGIGG